MAAHSSNDLTSAALRHIRDAEHLFAAGDHRSVEQAQHLAGFGPECIRKAALSARWGDKLLGHDLTDIGDDFGELLVALDPHAARAGALGLGARFPALAEWTPERRYDRTGVADEAEVGALIDAARRAVDEIFVALWLDGRLDGGAEW